MKNKIFCFCCSCCLGIGADDMFQLLAEYRQSHIRDTIEERMASTLRSTAVSITITSLTDLIAFCIGATSPFVSIRNFCACSGWYMYYGSSFWKYLKF